MSNTISDNQREGRCSVCPWMPCIDFDGLCPIDYVTFTRPLREAQKAQIQRDNLLKKTYFPEEPETLVVKVRDKIDLGYAQLLSKENPVAVFGEGDPENLDNIVLLNEKKSGIKIEEAYTLSWRENEIGEALEEEDRMWIETQPHYEEYEAKFKKE